MEPANTTLPPVSKVKVMSNVEMNQMFDYKTDDFDSKGKLQIFRMYEAAYNYPFCHIYAHFALRSALLIKLLQIQYGLHFNKALDCLAVAQPPSTGYVYNN